MNVWNGLHSVRNYVITVDNLSLRKTNFSTEISEKCITYTVTRHQNLKRETEHIGSVSSLVAKYNW
jgi:hypothetical protein